MRIISPGVRAKRKLSAGATNFGASGLPLALADFGNRPNLPASDLPAIGVLAAANLRFAAACFNFKAAVRTAGLFDFADLRQPFTWEPWTSEPFNRALPQTANSHDATSTWRLAATRAAPGAATGTSADSMRSIADAISAGCMAGRTIATTSAGGGDGSRTASRVRSSKWRSTRDSKRGVLSPFCAATAVIVLVMRALAAALTVATAPTAKT